MHEDEKPSMNQTDVVIHTKDGQTLWGYIQLEPNIRIQDIMNDERKFIPFFVLKENTRTGNHYHLRIMSKDFVYYIEEK